MRTRPPLRLLVALVAVGAMGSGCPRRAETPASTAAAPALVVRTIAVAHPQYRPDEYV